MMAGRPVAKLGHTRSKPHSRYCAYSSAFSVPVLLQVPYVQTVLPECTWAHAVLLVFNLGSLRAQSVHQL
jgi:hypothetical protein